MQTNSENAVAEEIEESIAKVNVRGVVKEISMKVLFAVAAALFVLAVLTICIYLLVDAIPTIGEIGFVKFFTDDRWLIRSERFGIGSLVVGTALSTVGALVVGVPIGLMTATFMAFYCPKWLYKIIKPLTNILAGIPSIVYGFFGLTVIVPISRELLGGGGLNLLTTSFVLGIMILPTIISISENSLRAVPKPFYEGAVALGATKERAIFRTMFPASSSGVLTAIILGMGRAIGETAAITLICGNIDQIPGSLADPFITLASAIASGMGYASTTNLERPALIAVAAVLLIIILLITTVVMLLKKKKY